jgi:tetratricopeptide (TPR) repeat protein
MRIIRNYKIFTSQRLAQKGKYGEAEKIVLELMNKYPRSVAYNTFLADIRLFSGKIESALAKYKLSKKILEENANISKENRRFLAAYINFRTTAIGFHKAGKEFANWREFSKLINDLEANRYLKRLFLLPE